ncbi:MAG: LysR family transcriptional regulator [Synergistes sp.]|nr:LysR family transcriptional regulator [Synergistes sp.]
MTLLQLQYFQVLAHTLHYTRAARELHISQPSLSYAIGELEKELSVPLFEREKRNIVLSPYGQQFLEYVERALLLLEEGRSVIEQISNKPKQIVRLGYFQSISASLVPALIESFYGADEANKEIRFHFTEAASWEIFTKIQDGEVDMGFCLHRANWANSVEVMRQPLFLAVHPTHPLAKHASVSVSDFAREPQIMLERDTSLRTQLNEIFERLEVTPDIVFEVRDCSTAIQYVALNFGVAVLPQVPAMDTLNQRVMILPISDNIKQLVRSIYLTTHKTRPLSPSALQVCDFIKTHFALE